MSTCEKKVLDTFVYRISSDNIKHSYDLSLLSVNGSSSKSLLVYKDGVKATLKEILELFAFMHSSNVMLHGDCNSLGVTLYSLDDAGNLVDYNLDSSRGIYVATIDSGLTRVLGVVFDKGIDSNNITLTFYEDL